MNINNGFNLSEVTVNTWVIQPVGGKPFYGSFSEVVLLAIYRYGFKIKEIEEAVKAMVELGHDSAHFGIYRTFIFSFNQTQKESLAS